MPALRRLRISLAGLCSAAALAGLPGIAAGAEAAHSGSPWTFFGEYCTKCHNAEDWAGGVAFDTLAEGDIAGNAEVME
jgi:hypothetical protein